MSIHLVKKVTQRIFCRFFSSWPRKFVAFPRNELKTVSPRNVVFITGCDSGLGFNLALFCHSLNMTVVAGCRDTNSKGAQILQTTPSPERIIPVEIDVTKEATISQAKKLITKLIEEKNMEFTALVNNAGVMCFGEFEWQTGPIFQNQIDVNLLGPMRVTHAFLPLIRKHRGRIINVTSHCGLQALPGLSPYTASKAGLKFWTEALRIELKKYGIQVVNFIPGSFVGSSNIAANQQIYVNEMWNHFNDEQKEFYGDYFGRYNDYLRILSGDDSPRKMADKKLFECFQHALLNIQPKDLYKHEPWRYTIYHWLFKLSPTALRDYFVMKFVSMPEYKARNELKI